MSVRYGDVPTIRCHQKLHAMNHRGSSISLSPSGCSACPPGLNDAIGNALTIPQNATAMLALSPFGSPLADVHLSDWSAWGWLGAMALLLTSGIIGCAAVGMGRFSYWVFYESGSADARPWLAIAGAALGVWVLSLWPFISALSSLVQHSRSIQFASWFTILGTLTITVGYFLASSGADRFASWNYGRCRPTAPKYLFLVALLPTGLIALIAMWIHIAERVHREGALSVVFELLFGTIVVVAMFVVIIKALVALSDFLSRRY